MSGREYFQKVILNHDQIKELEDVMRGHRDSFRENNSNRLYAIAGGVSSVFSVVGLFSPGVGTIGTLVSIIRSALNVITNSERQAFENVANNGFEAVDLLESQVRQMTSSYDLFEVEFAFLDRQDLNLKFPQGGGRITRMHRKGGGWTGPGGPY